ncbi:MAG: beta-propeller domain-containing protein [Candidatus Aenigmatarchaeota archaeon]
MKLWKVILLLIICLIVFSILYQKRPETYKVELKKFSSYEELKNFVKSSSEQYLPLVGIGIAREYGIESIKTGAPLAVPAAQEYSATNVQVVGVDEADVVKTDGQYIYSVYGNNLTIVEAYPLENAKVVSKISLNKSIEGIFINKDKLVIFASESYFYPLPLREYRGGLIPYYRYTPKTYIYVYDVSDKANPKVTREVYLNGSYYDSRMIGDYVYVIVNEPLEFYEDEIILPSVVEGNKVKEVKAEEIYYSPIFDYSYSFTNVIALNTQNDEEEINVKTFLIGATQNLYVSSNNIYIVYTKTYSIYDFYERIIDEAILPVVPQEVKEKIEEVKESNINIYDKMNKIEEVIENYTKTLNPEQAASFMKELQNRYEKVMEEIIKELEKTIIHKISISEGNIEYKVSGEVPGSVLNQFSMDEDNNHFRIATTSSYGREVFNNIYTLDENLNILGKIENIARTERIFAVRFVGDKAYMVTFRRTDPLFVIDLEDETNPKILGELKIPGYSDYLHPYDGTHLIGIGKDADDQGRELGVKISLFDVSDFSNPKEISKIVIGTRGSYTLVSSDHKAFLFSKSKNLLVIPVSVAENYIQKWQGAYVFNITQEGISERGRISHTEKPYDYDYEIKRTLYIDDILYTISNKMIKMNSLESLEELGKIEV